MVTCQYHSVPGKRPLPGKRPCTSFQWVLSIAASMDIISRVGAHAGQNRELCLSTHEDTTLIHRNLGIASLYKMYHLWYVQMHEVSEGLSMRYIS